MKVLKINGKLATIDGKAIKSPGGGVVPTYGGKALTLGDEVIRTPQSTQINENLVITSASLKPAKVASGKIATLGVKCTDDAATLVILDADNNKVEFKKSASSVKNGVTSFTATWTVTGNRGDVLNYTVVVYDSNGYRSSNTKQISVTIK